MPGLLCRHARRCVSVSVRPPRAALPSSARLQADGVQPTGTTYTSLLSAFGKAGQVEEALRVYQVRQQAQQARQAL